MLREVDSRLLGGPYCQKPLCTPELMMRCELTQEFSVRSSR